MLFTPFVGSRGEGNLPSFHVEQVSYDNKLFKLLSAVKQIKNETPDKVYFAIYKISWCYFFYFDFSEYTKTILPTSRRCFYLFYK